MMQWYVCDGSSDAQSLSEKVGVWSGSEKVFLTDDPVYLRTLDRSSRKSCVLGSVQHGISLSNIVAALRKDGLFEVIYLVADSPPCITGTKRLSWEELSGKAKLVVKNDTLENAPKLSATMPSFCAPEDETNTLELDEPDGIEVKLKKTDLHISKRAPVISVMSGRGGVGKTALVSTMAYIMGSWGLKVGILDGDFLCGNIVSYVGVKQTADLMRLIEDKSLISHVWDKLSVALDESGGVRLLGGQGKPEDAEVIYPHISRIIAGLSQGCDVVLVDNSSSFTEGVARVAKESDRIVFVADERASSVMSLVKAQQFVMRLGIERTRFIRAINKCDRNGMDKKFLEQVDVVGIQSQNFYVDDAGIHLSEMMTQGRACELAHENSDYTQSVAYMSARILQDLGRLPSTSETRMVLHNSHNVNRFLKLFMRKKAS